MQRMSNKFENLDDTSIIKLIFWGLISTLDFIIGYYADIANDCQVFHICQPVTYADGETETFKWSMICPAQTVFDQVKFIIFYIRRISLTNNRFK